jgi:hypothetical protein
VRVAVAHAGGVQLARELGAACGAGSEAVVAVMGQPGPGSTARRLLAEQLSHGQAAPPHWPVIALARSPVSRWMVKRRRWRQAAASSSASAALSCSAAAGAAPAPPPPLPPSALCCCSAAAGAGAPGPSTPTLQPPARAPPAACCAALEPLLLGCVSLLPGSASLLCPSAAACSACLACSSCGRGTGPPAAGWSGSCPACWASGRAEHRQQPAPLTSSSRLVGPCAAPALLASPSSR